MQLLNKATPVMDEHISKPFDFEQLVEEIDAKVCMFRTLRTPH